MIERGACLPMFPTRSQSPLLYRHTASQGAQDQLKFSIWSPKFGLMIERDACLHLFPTGSQSYIDRQQVIGGPFSHGHHIIATSVRPKFSMYIRHANEAATR